MNKSNWQEEMLWATQNKRKGYGFSPHPVESDRDIRIRMRMVWSVFVIAISLLCAKIFYLQVIERGQHQLTSYSNHVELLREYAPRGIVRDRNNIPLVTNEVQDNKIARIYPLKNAISPVMGYMSQVREDEIGCQKGLCYQTGMQIGRAGIEQIMEASLRGQDGGRLVEVDSSGKEVRELGSNKAEPGQDLVLSMDSRLQDIAYQAMHDRPGSVVALDMQGKVMALVSSPAYDPSDIGKYLADTEKLYFLNRPVAGMYPPGSVFKLVTAVSGLEESAISKDSQFDDTGEIKIGEYRYGNWYFDQYGKTEGVIGLAKALSRSNDIYFYKVGEALGVTKLVSWAKKFGLGEKTGIELPGERGGVVPDELSKERRTGEKWFLGNTYHLSIGQGDLLTTPLQVARMTLGVISGRLCKTSILKGSTVSCSDLGIKTEDIELVKEGMKGACTAGGTAFPFFDFQPSVLCKTGTAQHGGQKTKEDLPHAWITVAYPGENPEMILVVMLEAAGEGSAEAGPVARKILDEWKVIKKE